MKRVFTNKELPHIWAHQQQPEGHTSNENMFFDARVIYSYGRHFPIAMHVKNARGDGAILFTTADYSVTTRRHKSLVLRACYGDVFEVELSQNSASMFNRSDVWTNKTGRAQADSLVDMWLAQYQTRIDELTLETARARTHKEYKESALLALVEQANKFSKFFGREQEFQVADKAEILARHKANEDKRKRDEAQKERDALVRAQEDIERWCAGDRDISIPYNVGKCFLRVIGDEVETSKGARFPVEHARKGLRFVRAVKAKGEAWQANGHTFHLGHYAIEKVDAAGNVTAGCHFVTYAEIERIAPMLERVEVTE